MDDTKVSKNEKIPSVCTKKAPSPQSMLRLSRTHHSNTSYYLVENNLIWFVDGDEYQSDRWPKKLYKIFPGVEGNVDAILYDDNLNTYLVFKVC
jgi:hypothetical protein